VYVYLRRTAVEKEDVQKKLSMALLSLKKREVL
jgi:hypothetical protein